MVTGAAGGVGGSVASMLAREGLHIALVGRTAGSLEDTVSAVEAAGSSSRCYAGDLSRDEELVRLGHELASDLPRLDVLVHCAGTYAHGSVESTSVEELDRQYRVNARAPYSLTRALLPSLRAAQGQVVLINSSTGLRARGEVAAYSASKHALTALAGGLRDEVNADDIRVTSLFLGRTATKMQERVHQIEGKPYRPERLIQPDDVAQVVRTVLALPRTAEVTDIRLRPMTKPG